MVCQSKPLISVLVPVYNTESYLESCLKSIFEQDYPNIEIIITDDASTGTDCSGRNCRSIAQAVKAMYRKSRIRLQYTSHVCNKGLVETRRTGFFASRGAYILIVDSDDTLAEGAVASLYGYASAENADIVHGKAELLYDSAVSADEKLLQILYNRAQCVYEGILDGNAVFDGFLCRNNHSGMLWGKLYRRELWNAAFEQIPPVRCTMGEDSLLYFFLSKYARRYAGFGRAVYNYRIETGITKHKTITDMAEWERLCSSASVFTILFSYMESHPSAEVQKAAVRRNCRTFLAKNIIRLRTCVPAPLQGQAYSVLCSYWGRDFVERMETAVDSHRSAGSNIIEPIP